MLLGHEKGETPVLTLPAKRGGREKQKEKKERLSGRVFSKGKKKGKERTTQAESGEGGKKGGINFGGKKSLLAIHGEKKEERKQHSIPWG